MNMHKVFDQELGKLESTDMSGHPLLTQNCLRRLCLFHVQEIHGFSIHVRLVLECLSSRLLRRVTLAFVDRLSLEILKNFPLNSISFYYFSIRNSDTDNISMIIPSIVLFKVTGSDLAETAFTTLMLECK